GAWAKGTEGQHLKLRLDDGQGGPPFDAIAFRLGHLAEYLQRPRAIDVAYTLDRNDWNGSSSLQLNVKDFRRSQYGRRPPSARGDSRPPADHRLVVRGRPAVVALQLRSSARRASG